MNWLVASLTEAVAILVEAGGTVVVEPIRSPVGRLAVVNDHFGNARVVLDLFARRN